MARHRHRFRAAIRADGLLRAAGDTLSVGERDWGENHTIARAANRGGVRLRSETGNQHGEFVQTSHGAASGAAVRRAPIRYC